MKYEQELKIEKERLTGVYQKRGLDALIDLCADELCKMRMALHHLMHECEWTRERNGYYVESRSARDFSVSRMLLEAREAMSREKGVKK